ncbi:MULTISPECIES: hypothetical protein [unclassified Bradyrhizobium]|uniref:hypothetical protein n=1 Tax=unclassified Bradyrhizobium TaxID=2631580 RepID=UPI002FF43D51
MVAALNCGKRRARWTIEAALDQAWGDEQDAAYELLKIDPTTPAGVIALLTYACDYDDATHGMGWPQDVWADDLFVAAGLVDILPKLMSRVGT